MFNEDELAIILLQFYIESMYPLSRCNSHWIISSLLTAKKLYQNHWSIRSALDFLRWEDPSILSPPANKISPPSKFIYNLIVFRMAIILQRIKNKNIALDSNNKISLISCNFCLRLLTTRIFFLSSTSWILF